MVALCTSKLFNNDALIAVEQNARQSIQPLQF